MGRKRERAEPTGSSSSSRSSSSTEVSLSWQPDDAATAAAAALLDNLEETEFDVPLRLDASTSAASASGPPLAELEAARLLAMRTLSEIFRDKCSVLGAKKHYAHFEAWLWAARAESMTSGVVPPIPHAGAAAREELITKLTAAGLSELAACAASDALQSRAFGLCEGLKRTGTAASAQPPSRPAVTVRRLQAAASTDTLVLSCGGVDVEVGAAHLAKLQSLFRASAARREKKRKKNQKKKQKEKDSKAAASPATSQHPPPTATLAPTAAPTLPLPPTPRAADAADSADSFLEAAFCTLARLQTLQGGSALAGGMQAACPGAAFDVLRRELGVTCECFASPLNCRFVRFCSASADVDRAFGSEGSFFSFRPASGAFLANPPFVPATVLAMAARIDELLADADANADADAERRQQLTFVVVIPRWPDDAGWKALSDSRHATCVLTLPRSKHCYIDGGQQYGRRATPLRLSNHDSSVFFLQSAAAASARPVTAQTRQALLEAFRAGFGSSGASSSTET